MTGSRLLFVLIVVFVLMSVCANVAHYIMCKIRHRPRSFIYPVSRGRLRVVYLIWFGALFGSWVAGFIHGGTKDVHQMVLTIFVIFMNLDAIWRRATKRQTSIGFFGE